LSITNICSSSSPLALPKRLGSGYILHVLQAGLIRKPSPNKDDPISEWRRS